MINIQLKYFTLVLLSLLISVTAWSQPNLSASICERILTATDVTHTRDYIKRRIEERTALLKEGKPFLVEYAPNGEKKVISLLDGMNREYVRPICDSAKNHAVKRVRDVAAKWLAALKEQVRIENESRPRFVHADEEHVPKTPFLQKHREVVKQILPKLTNRMSAGELEILVLQVLFEGRAGKVKPDGQNHSVATVYARKLMDTSEEITEAYETLIAESIGQKNPDWNLLNNALEGVYREFLETLKREFPLDLSLSSHSEKNAKLIREVVEAAEAPWDSQLNLARMNEHGIAEILLPELALRLYYEPELATTILHSIHGLFPNEEAPILLLDHGEGTVKSVAGSFKYTLPKFLAYGYNPIAMNLPKAGTGIDLAGLHDTLAYLDYRNHWVRNKADSLGKQHLPIILLGRSMGSTKGLAHLVYYHLLDNALGAYVLSSYSSLETIKEQTQNIFEQVRKGLVKGVVPDSLANADLFSEENLKDWEKIEKTQPELFAKLGENVLFLQGRDDEDGGEFVERDVLNIKKRFAAKSHYYSFDNALKDYFKANDPEKVAILDNMNSEGQEGKHFIFVERPNMSKEVGEKMFPGVPKEFLPAPQLQFVEADATIAGLIDFLADSHPTNPAQKKNQELFKKLRERVIANAKKNPKAKNKSPQSYFEAHLEVYGVTLKDVLEAAPGRATMESRLHKVLEFWKQRRESND